MKTEIEAKWLDIDLDDMRSRLKSIGAKLEAPERIMTRKIYDYPDQRLQKVSGWVRLRDEGDKITLSYKQLNDRTVTGTKEVTVMVDDVDATSLFLEAVGLEVKSIQETKRESWKLGKVEIELDTWPWIPSLLEIEAPSEDELKHTAELLSLDYAKALHGSVETAYQAVYDVTEAEIDAITEAKFGDVPKWLADRRL
jgi:adenylate cyclase class 2